MINPEKGMFIVASPPDAPTRTKRRVDIPPFSPEPKKLPKTSKKALIARLAGALLAVAGTAGPAVDHHINNETEITLPAIGRDIASIPGFYWDFGKSAVEDIQGLFNKEKEVVVPAIFDPNTTKPQIIKAGPNGNARAMTTKEMQDFINQTPPVFEEPKPGEQAPKIGVILPVNPENATQVSITRISQDTHNGKNSYYYDVLKIQIEGDGVPFSLPLIEGAKSVDAKLSVNASGISQVVLRYYFNDGRVKHGRITFSDNNFTPTDTMKNIPTYEARNINSLEQLEAVPTKTFNIQEDSLITLFYPKGLSVVYFALDMVDSFILSPSSVALEGKVLYPTPPSRF